MKCIICGEKDSVERGLCEDCLFKSVSITFDASEDIVICPKCGGIKIGKRWHYKNKEHEMLSNDYNESIMRVARETIEGKLIDVDEGETQKNP